MPNPSRRHLLLAAGVATTATAALQSTSAAAATTTSTHRGGDLIAYVGSRTTRARNARGAGITVWRVPRRSRDRWSLLQTVAADDGEASTPAQPGEIPVNPSFLTLSAAGDVLYAVHGDSAFVSAFAVDPRTGTLSLLGTVDGGRRNPVHLTVDPSGRWLVVAYLAPPGAVVVFPIRADGSLGPVASTLELPGTPGPHKKQQLGPNPHHVVFDPTGRWLLVVDRGQDRVFVAQLDAATGVLRLNDPGWVQVREVEGPRHVSFHPRLPVVHVVSELRSTVTTFGWDVATGRLTPRQVVPSQPPTFTDDTRGAEVVTAPSGAFVYATNRSGAGDETPGGPDPDTVGVFEVGRDGTLTAREWVSSEGVRPRFAGLDPTGETLVVANENSDTLVGLELGAGGRRLRSRGVLARTGSPTTVVWREAPQGGRS